jgi:hypothetical protein
MRFGQVRDHVGVVNAKLDGLGSEVEPQGRQERLERVAFESREGGCNLV